MTKIEEIKAWTIYEKSKGIDTADKEVLLTEIERLKKILDFLISAEDIIAR